MLADYTFRCLKYGVCVFRKTGLTDETHVDFSRRLGELDTIRKYMIGGRKPRYEYYELFDAGNVDDKGNVLDPNSPKALFQRVCPFSPCPFGPKQ